MTILEAKTLGHAVNAADGYGIAAFPAGHLNDEYRIHLAVVTQIRNQLIPLRG